MMGEGGGEGKEGVREVGQGWRWGERCMQVVQVPHKHLQAGVSGQRQLGKVTPTPG